LAKFFKGFIDDNIQKSFIKGFFKTSCYFSAVFLIPDKASTHSLGIMFVFRNFQTKSYNLN